MKPLAGRVAVVTGASRGIGKGCAIELGAAGATVYVTGRTLQEGGAPLPGTVAATAATRTWPRSSPACATRPAASTSS